MCSLLSVVWVFCWFFCLGFCCCCSQEAFLSACFFCSYRFLETLVASCLSEVLSVVAGCMGSLAACLKEDSSPCWLAYFGGGFELGVRGCLKQSITSLKCFVSLCFVFSIYLFFSSDRPCQK